MKINISTENVFLRNHLQKESHNILGDRISITVINERAPHVFVVEIVLSVFHKLATTC